MNFDGYRFKETIMTGIMTIFIPMGLIIFWVFLFFSAIIFWPIGRLRMMIGK